MKTKKFNRLLGLHLAIFATSYSGYTFSHELSGSLGEPFFSTDVYAVQCSADSGGDPDNLEFRILDSTQTPGGGKLSVVVVTDAVVTQTGDKVRGDANFSPLHSVQMGAGPYVLVVHKLKNGGNKVYTLEYHCKSSTGAHVGTQLVTIQNQ
jgi:hypothetical protein